MMMMQTKRETLLTENSDFGTSSDCLRVDARSDLALILAVVFDPGVFDL